MKTKIITHGELRNGMLNWRQGILFEVTNLRSYSDSANDKLIIRFEGKIVGGDQSLKGTAYDGGTYGAYADVPATIQVTEK